MYPLGLEVVITCYSSIFFSMLLFCVLPVMKTIPVRTHIGQLLLAVLDVMDMKPISALVLYIFMMVIVSAIKVIILDFTAVSKY